MRFSSKVSPDTIKEYASAAKSVGDALMPYGTLGISIATLLWKAGAFKRRGPKGTKKSVQQEEGDQSPRWTKRRIAAFCIFVLSGVLYMWAAYADWGGQANLDSIRLYTASLALIFLYIVVNDGPIAKVDILWLTSVMIVLMFALSILGFRGLEQLDKEIKELNKSANRSVK